MLLEIKLSEEEAKTGFTPGSPELRQALERASGLQQVRVRGLMTIAPLDERPETARVCFRQLRDLRDELARQYQRIELQELSMGMSGDFDVAIKGIDTREDRHGAFWCSRGTGVTLASDWVKETREGAAFAVRVIPPQVTPKSQA